MGASIEEIAGTASLEEKSDVKRILELFHYDEWFASEVGRRIRVVEVDLDVLPSGDGTKKRKVGRTVFEVEVKKDMVNGMQNLHGGCSAFLVDICTSAMLMLFPENGWREVHGGVSSSINMMYHAPAPLGTVLQIISTSVAVGERTANARCEIIDKNRGTMISSGTHLKMKPSTPKSKL